MDSSLNNTVLKIGLSKEDKERIKVLRESKEERPKGLKACYEHYNKKFQSLGRVKLKEKVVFFQLLAVMINAGVPLIRSIYVLSDQATTVKMKTVIRSLAQSMEEGVRLSESMNAHPKVFTEAERGMIASGEASGNLNMILHDLAKQAEKNQIIVSKVKGAMVYPVAILVVMSIALFLMLTLVVPKIEVLFTDGGADLPMSTQLLIKASEIAQNQWQIVILLVLALLGGLALVRRSERGRYSIDLAMLYLPIFGPLLRKLMVSRFTRLLSSLMNAGLPIVKALEINANALGNAVYKRRIEFAAQDVSQGIPLGENLTESKLLFPPMVASMVLVGEQTANLSEVSSKIADHYENEVDTAVASLSKLMEPLILVVMGLMVGFVVAAVMQPILSLSDLASTL